jgi:hypothetical protein
MLHQSRFKQMEMENPLGKHLDIGSNKGKIIGIVKDFHFNDLHTAIFPGSGQHFVSLNLH